MKKYFFTAAALIIAVSLFVVGGAGSPAAPKAQKGAVTSNTQSKARFTVASWNIRDMGSSKDPGEIEYIAKAIRNTKADVVLIQEVVAKDGAQAVARLVDELNRLGKSWDYAISDPTDGPGKERYATLWVASAFVALGRGSLVQELKDGIDREPFALRLENKKSKTSYCFVNFHAVPKAKKPATEIQQLGVLRRIYSRDVVVLGGDFNLSSRHESFSSLYSNSMAASLHKQKTSLRMKWPKESNGAFSKPSQAPELLLAEEYDNIFADTLRVALSNAKAYYFHADFPSIDAARDISDHIPVSVEITEK